MNETALQDKLEQLDQRYRALQRVSQPDQDEQAHDVPVHRCVDAAVEDDGIGMEADLTEIKGSGLFSIPERLGHVGGSIHIESAPGRGTKIRLSAPLTNGKAKKARMES